MQFSSLRDVLMQFSSLRDVLMQFSSLRDVLMQFSSLRDVLMQFNSLRDVLICVQLYYVNCHCLTLHVSAYKAIFKCVLYFYFHMPEGSNKEKANRQTYTQETTTKLTKKSSTEKHKWKHAECDHVRKKVKTSEADSFRHMEIKIYYTPEDGHVGRNM
jgi:hypothetical protein